MATQTLELISLEFLTSLVFGDYKTSNEIYQANLGLVSELESKIKSRIFQQHYRAIINDGLTGHNFIQSLQNSNLRKANIIFDKCPEIIGKVFSRYYGLVGYYIAVRDSELQKELLNTHPEIKAFLENFGNFSEASDLFLSMLNNG